MFLHVYVFVHIYTYMYLYVFELRLYYLCLDLAKYIKSLPRRKGL